MDADKVGHYISAICAVTVAGHLLAQALITKRNTSPEGISGLPNRRKHMDLFERIFQSYLRETVIPYKAHLAPTTLKPLLAATGCKLLCCTEGTLHGVQDCRYDTQGLGEDDVVTGFTVSSSILDVMVLVLSSGITLIVFDVVPGSPTSSLIVGPCGALGSNFQSHPVS